MDHVNHVLQWIVVMLIGIESVLAEINGEAWAGLMLAIGGLIGAVAVAVKQWFPYKLQVKKIDQTAKISKLESDLETAKKDVHDRVILASQLTDSLEGMYLISEECQADHDHSYHTSIEQYEILKRFWSVLKDLGKDPGEMPKKPEPRERDTEKLARARYLIGEGRQAKQLIEDSFVRRNTNAN